MIYQKSICRIQIGVDIYSKLDNKTIRFWLSANHIIEFLNSKYNLIHKATEWVKKEIDNYNTKWQKRKVNRNLSTIEMLRDIKEILAERHSDDSFIDETIDLLECRISDDFNSVKLNQYKEALILTLPQVCDWIDSMQDDKMYPDNFFDLLNPNSKDTYNQEQYELEKIFSNLSDDVVDYKTYIQNKDHYLNKNDFPNIAFYEIGLFCAKSFFDNIGNKYLNYNPSDIGSATEVKLLVRTVLFLERKK